jgi:DNA invertase Pin-like site-specific DNA recombinase
MKIGYARVSTEDQNLDLQLDALNKAGCELIYQEKISGSKKERPELQKMLIHLRAKDTLVVWKLDRLGRSLRDLLTIVNNLQDKGINFQCLQEGFNTDTSGGKLVFHIFGALAEFEKEVIRERTKAGLAAARARGRQGGRPTKITQEIILKAKALYKDFTITPNEICKTLGLSRSSFYKALKAEKIKEL